MLTRREKLLIRPWQQRRYNNHRRKVLSALPAIDVGPPATRNHVSTKLKKLQQEEERTAKIEEQNFKLLRELGSIMGKNRLDNHWIVEPPNFLHRVTIYKPRKEKLSETSSCEDSISEINLGIRKQRCSACSPYKIKPIKVIPEERVPWEAATLSARKSRPHTANQGISHNNQGKEREAVSIHQLTLTSGNLQLAVKFPAHSGLKLHNGYKEKLLKQNFCECKAIKIEKQNKNI